MGPSPKCTTGFVSPLAQPQAFSQAHADASFGLCPIRICLCASTRVAPRRQGVGRLLFARHYAIACRNGRSFSDQSLNESRMVHPRSITGQPFCLPGGTPPIWPMPPFPPGAGSSFIAPCARDARCPGRWQVHYTFLDHAGSSGGSHAQPVPSGKCDLSSVAHYRSPQTISRASILTVNRRRQFLAYALCFPFTHSLFPSAIFHPRSLSRHKG